MGGKREQLRALTVQQITESIQGIKSLGGLLNDAVVDHPEDQLPDMIAALHQVEVLSNGVRKVMESQGVVIFSRNGLAEDVSLPTPAPVDSLPAPLPEKLGEELEDPNRPKTFGELLTRRIDTELLIEERISFTPQGLYEITGSTAGARKALREEGLSPKQKKFTREEMIRVLIRFLVTPNGKFRPKDSYERSRFILPFLPVRAVDFKRWSEEVGHDWSKNPTVDHETAMQIRGLAAFNKLLAKRK